MPAFSDMHTHSLGNFLPTGQFQYLGRKARHAWRCTQVSRAISISLAAKTRSSRPAGSGSIRLAGRRHLRGWPMSHGDERALLRVRPADEDR